VKTQLPGIKIVLLISSLLFIFGCDFSSGSSSSDAGTADTVPPVAGEPAPGAPAPDDPGDEDPDPVDPGAGTPAQSEQNASFRLTLTSYAKNDTPVSPPANTALYSSQAEAIQLVEGQILSVNRSTGVEEVFNWALEIDEGSLEISSQVSLPLDPEVYDFYFLMSSGSYQYAAISKAWIILEGQNSVSFMIHPVIGENIPDIHILQELAEFQFQYDEDVVSEFDDPSFGISIDNSGEHRFSINPETGLSSTFVYLPAGTYEFGLNFYDGMYLKSVLLDGQTTITITENGGTVHLDVVPLILENTYTYNPANNTAEFDLVVPDTVVDEAGGVENIVARFSLTGAENNPLVTIVTLSQDESVYRGTITIPGFVPGTIVWAIQIADITGGNSDVYAFCGQEIVLTGDAQTLSCDFTLLARSIAEKDPAGDLTINVETLGFPIAGAVVYADDDQFLGLTANGTGSSTSGQLTVLLPADNYTIRAEFGDGTRIVTTTVAITSNQSSTLNLELPAPPNSAPVAQDLDAETEQAMAVPITLYGSDPDPWDNLTWEKGDDPSHGEVSFNGSIATYTPDETHSGTDSFTYRVSDGNLSSQLATVTIQITADQPPVVNHVPDAIEFDVEMDQDDELEIILEGRDEDEDDLSFHLASQATNGTVSIDGNKAIYRPITGFHGEDQFEYTAFDEIDYSVPAVVTIMVKEVVPLPVNQAPIAEDIYVTMDQDQQVEFALLATDPDGDEGLTYSIKSQPANGSVSISEAGNTAILIPNSGFYGTDSFTYEVSDETDTSEPATVGITVLQVITPPVNTAPVADDLDVTTVQDQFVEFTLSGTDDEMDDLEFSVAEPPEHGTIEIKNSKATYTPDLGHFGSDSFTYTAYDGKLTSDPANVTITIDEAVVIPENNAPTAADMDVTTDQYTAVTFTLPGSDLDEGAELIYAIETQPMNGTVSIRGDQAVYTPDAETYGEDSFTYKVSDGMEVSDPAEVTISINAVEPPPAIEELVLTTSLSTWPWRRDKDEIRLDDPLKVIIPSHDSLEVLEGNPNWFMLILKFDGIRCVYSATLHNTSGWRGFLGWHGFNKRLTSPVCFHGKVKAGDEIIVRHKVKAYLLTSDPREDMTTVRVTIDVAE
jgi:Big-like domain-containing protein